MTTILEHRYAPRGAAKTLFARRDSEVLMSGPAGTGKSRACMEKLHMTAMRNPGIRGLIVRQTAASLGNTALVTWRSFVAVEALQAGLMSFYGGSTQESPAYRYTNGSTINIGGMDKPSKIMSSEYDIIYVQEATELNEPAWEALTTRLRNGRISFQQLIADCNPDSEYHWLKRRADAGRTVMLNTRHEDNPVYFDAAGEITERGQAYMSILDALTGVRHKRLKLGLWVAAENQVYEEFDPLIHIREHGVEKFRPPKEWPRFWSIDFGYTNPFVCQFWTQDPDGRLYLYRELYRTRRLVEDHARDILAIVAPDGQWKEPKPQRIVCDHDAEGRATLERVLGLPTTPAKKAVTEGIQAVSSRLAVQGDGRPRLFLCRDAVVDRDPELIDAMKPASTIEELPSYVWDTGLGKPPKESPVKVNDHGCDAMRYMVMEIDENSRPRVRVMTF